MAGSTVLRRIDHRLHDGVRMPVKDAPAAVRAEAGRREVEATVAEARRRHGVLRIRALHLEPGAPAETRDALADELEALAGWLGLEAVSKRSA